MIEDLLRGGLADVDDGPAVEVPGPEFGGVDRSVMTDLLAGVGRVEPGEELSEQIA